MVTPLSTIQAYRLEMGISLENERGSNLYKFWSASVSNYIYRELKRSKSKILVNLASDEYFKVIDKKIIKYPIITAKFKEFRGDELKFISFNAKKARGLMSRYIIEQKIDDAESLKGFDYENYRFEESLSTENNLMFVR